MSRFVSLIQIAEALERVRAADGSDVGGHDLLHSGWYTTEQVANLIDVDPSTLRRWRTSDPMQGPPFVKLTRRVTLYSIPDVQEWLVAQRIDPAGAA